MYGIYFVGLILVLANIGKGERWISNRTLVCRSLHGLFSCTHMSNKTYKKCLTAQMMQGHKLQGGGKTTEEIRSIIRDICLFAYAE